MKTDAPRGIKIERLAVAFGLYSGKKREPDVRLVYSRLLTHSNRIQFVILESENTIHKAAYEEILSTKERLFEGEYIFKDLVPQPHVPVCGRGTSFVYFLFQDGQLVYIGQTKNLLNRISCHADSSKEFNEMCCFEVDPDNLSLIETLNISFYKPPLNTASADPMTLFDIVLRQSCFEYDIYVFRNRGI
jgi:hypothetical protein